jgi:REP element-mobilizing transposase RayT
MLMVIAYHLIWTAYGTWLPNDPRGSGSHRVVAPQLADLGELHFGRKKIQPSRRVVKEFYDEAEERLLYDVIRFDSRQVELIADGFADAIREHRDTCYACAIMPDHVHLVIRKHRHNAEQMIDTLQSASRQRLIDAREVAPLHPVWTLNGCKRFLATPQHVRTAIRYVANNPLKLGLPAQHWPFVIAYDNWPFHKRRT